MINRTRLDFKISWRRDFQRFRHALGWLKAERIAIVVFLGLLILRLARPGMMAQLPETAVVLLAFWAVLIYPGLVITGMVPKLAGADWLKRLPIAFVLSYAIWGIIASLMMTIHSTWRVFNILFLCINGLLILAYGLWSYFDYRKARMTSLAPLVDEGETPSHPDPAVRPTHTFSNILLIVILLALLTALVPLTTRYKLDSDVLTYVAFVGHNATQEHFSADEPLFGTGLPLPTRSMANAWFLLPAFLTRVTGYSPITLMQYYIPALLAILAILSLYVFVLEFNGSRNFALFAAIFFVILLGAKPFQPGTAYTYPTDAFFRRIMSDKFMLMFIHYPISLALGWRFLRTRRWRDYLLAGLAGMGIGVTHPLIAVFYVISMLAFSGIHWLVDAESRGQRLRLLGRMMLLVGICGAVMSVPFLQSQLESNRASFLFITDFSTIPLFKTNSLIFPFWSIHSLGIPSSSINTSDMASEDASPVLLHRVYGQIGAGRLVILNATHYFTSPGFIFDIPTILAFLLMPLLLIWIRKDRLAQFLLITMLVYPVIDFNPYLAPLVGRFVTPWLVFRFTWPLPTALVLAYFSYKVIGWYLNAFDRERHPRLLRIEVSLLPAVFLLVFFVLLWPKIDGYTNFLLNANRQTDGMSTQMIDYIQENLAGNPSGVILADYDTNITFAAIFDKPDIVAQRYNTTSEEFPSDHQDEAQQRSQDVDYYTSATLADQEIGDILKRYHVNYVLVKKDQGLYCQIPYFPTLFKPLFNDENYRLFSVNWPLQDDPVLKGNSLLLAGQLEAARTVFEAVLQQTPGDVSARLGLGQALIGLGYPQQALADYQLVLADHPDDECVMQKVADGYFESGNLSEAIATYNTLLQLDPTNADTWMKVGDIYLLQGDQANAQASYWHGLTLTAELDPQKLEQNLINSGIITQNMTEQDLYNVAAESKNGGAAFSMLAARLYQKKGWSEDSYNLAEKILVLAPTAANQQFVAGSALSAGKTDQALEHIQRAIQLNGSDPTNYQILGDIYSTLGQQDNAIAAYQKSTELSLNQLDWGLTTRMKWGDIYASSGDPEQALQFYLQTGQTLVSAADPFVAIGDLKMTQGLVTEALAAYDQATQADPINVNPYLRRAAYYQANGQDQAAFDQYQQALQLSSNSYAVWNALGAWYTAHDLYSDAYQAFETSLKYSPTNAGAYLGLADLYQLEKHWDSAIAAARQAVIQAPKSPNAYVTMGDVYNAEGETDLAIQAYNQALQISANRLGTYSSLSNIYWQQGLFSQAINTNRDAVIANPDSGQARLALAANYRSRGKLDEADQMFAQAIARDPTLVAAYTNRADIALIKSNDRQAALGFYQQMLDSNPDSSSAYLALGNFYQNQDQFSDAETAFRKALSLAPDNLAIYANLSQLASARGDLSEAMQFLQDGLQSGQETSTQMISIPADQTSATVVQGTDLLLENLGDQYLQQDDITSAETAYQQAIELNPQNIPAYTGLARAFQAEGNLYQAQKILKNCIAANPQSAAAVIALATFQNNQGQTDQAEVSYLQAITLEPTNGSTYSSLGQFYQSQKRWADALRIYQQGLIISPNNTGMYLAIGSIYQAEGQLDQALTWFENAIPLDRSNPTPYLSLAGFYQSQAEWDKAVEALQNALTVQPSNAIAYVQLGNIHLRFQRYADAESAYKTACQLSPDTAGCWNGLGNTYKALHQYPQAEDSYRQAIRVAPDDPNGYIALGQFYQAMNQDQEALQTFSQGLQICGYQTGKISVGNNTPTAGLLCSNPSGLLLARAAIETSQGDWQTAQVDYEIAWKDTPSLMTGRALASFYLHRGLRSQAEEIYTALTKLPEADAQSFVDLGSFYATQADWQDAEDFYQQALQLDPAYTAAYAGLGRVAQNQGRVDDALKIYQQSTAAAPNDPQAFFNLGDAYLLRHDIPDARQAYYDGLALDPANLTGLVKLDNLSVKTGGAGLDFAALIKPPLYLPSSILYTTVAFQYQVRGDWQNALAWYQKAVDYDPSNSANWLALANYYRARQEWDQALEAVTHAAQLAPASSAVFQTRGAVQVGMGLLDDALVSYSQAIQADRSQAYSYISLATVQIELTRTEMATLTFDTALAINPTNVFTYQAFGQAYVANGNYDQARAIYQLGLARMPGAADLLASLGGLDKTPVLQAQQDLETAGAIYNFSQYLFKRAGNTDEQHTAARLLKNAEQTYQYALSQLAKAQQLSQDTQSNYDAVLAAYNEALRLQPGNVSALIGLGQLADSFGHTEEALNYFEQAVAANPTNVSSMNALGNYYLKLNQPQDALPLFEKILKTSPGNTGAYFGIVRTYQAMGEPDAAAAAESLRSSLFWWQNYVNYFRQRELVELARQAASEVK